MFSFQTKKNRIIALLVLMSLSTNVLINLAHAVPPSNQSPIITEIHSFKYNGIVYVWGTLKDPDGPNENVTVIKEGDVSDATMADSSGFFMLTAEGAWIDPPIIITVTATDPQGGSMQVDASIYE